MALGFRVTYQSADLTQKGEWVLSQLPIRIGRNVLNHCHVDDRYVSDFHAVIELIDDRLCVRDLRSRNGVFAPNGKRVEPDVPYRLESPGHFFALGNFFNLRVEVFEQRASFGPRASNARGSVLGNRAMLDPGPADREAPQGAFGSGRPSPGFELPAQGDSRYSAGALPPLGAPQVARPPWMRGAPEGAWGNEQAPRVSNLPSISPLDPGYDGAPGRLSSVPRSGDERPAYKGTQQLTMSAEALAVLGLRELAASLVPNVPLQTTGDIARLLTKLHDTVEVFCRCFVPLREGYAQFISQMDLSRAASQRSLNRSPSAMRVETARDPATVASALLDWRNQDYDAPDVVEGIFADLMIHQIAVIEGVMRGVQALLDELSPDSVERALKDQGSPALLGHYRALWKTFQGRYEELSNATRAFELVFGSDFAASYREYLSRQRTQ